MFRKTLPTGIPTRHRCARATHRWRMSAVFLGLFGPLVGCNITVTPDPPKTARQTFNRTVASGNVGSISVEARTGNVKIAIDPDAEEMVISGTKAATALPGSNADEAVRAIDIDVRVAESDPAQVFVQFDAPPDTLLITYKADFNIVAPNGMEVRIEIEDGDVTIIGNEGEVTILIDDSGHIVVKDQVGDVRAVTDAGRIMVHGTGGSIDARNRSGDIEIGASPVPGGAVLARSVTGDVSVEVPTDFGTELDLSTLLGKAEAELEGFVIDEISLEFNRITATLNGGVGEVVIASEFGDVFFGGR